MRTRRLGRTGLVVPEICLGTMTFGSMADEATSLRCLDMAFDAGVNFIDTAEVYPVPPDPKWAGRSEEICAKWLAGRPRDAVIARDQGGRAAAAAGSRRPCARTRRALDRHHIERAVEASLMRLQTDYIDLYQTHWPDPYVPIEDTLEALDRLVEQGKVRAIGCSNQRRLRAHQEPVDGGSQRHRPLRDDPEQLQPESRGASRTSSRSCASASR